MFNLLNTWNLYTLRILNERFCLLPEKPINFKDYHSAQYHAVEVNEFLT